MNCEIKMAGDVTVFAMQGNIVFSQIKYIHQAIMGGISQSSTNKFIIDLGAVAMIDSSGYGFIVSVYKTAVSRKGLFAVSRPNESVSHDIRILGLTRYFKIYMTEEDATEAMSLDVPASSKINYSAYLKGLQVKTYTPKGLV